MLCPVCKVELKIADRQGVEIDYCPQCRGVWLDRGELDKLIERASVAYAAPPSAPPAQPAARFDDDYDDDDYQRRGGAYPQQPYPPQGQYPPNAQNYPQGQYPPGQYPPKKKKTFLGEVFDIFD